MITCVKGKYSKARGTRGKVVVCHTHHWVGPTQLLVWCTPTSIWPPSVLSTQLHKSVSFLWGSLCFFYILSTWLFVVVSNSVYGHEESRIFKALANKIAILVIAIQTPQHFMYFRWTFAVEFFSGVYHPQDTRDEKFSSVISVVLGAIDLTWWIPNSWFDMNTSACTINVFCICLLLPWMNQTITMIMF